MKAFEISTVFTNLTYFCVGCIFRHFAKQTRDLTRVLIINSKRVRYIFCTGREMITCRSLPRVQFHKLKGVDMAHELQHMRCKQFTGPENFPDTLRKTGEGGGGNNGWNFTLRSTPPPPQKKTKNKKQKTKKLSKIRGSKEIAKRGFAWSVDTSNVQNIWPINLTEQGKFFTLTHYAIIFSLILVSW